MARDEDDQAIERDLVPLKAIDESLRNNELQVKDRDIKDRLESKHFKNLLKNKFYNYSNYLISEKLSG